MLALLVRNLLHPGKKKALIKYSDTATTVLLHVALVCSNLFAEEFLKSCRKATLQLQ